MELGIALRLPVFSDCLSVFFQAPKNQGPFQWHIWDFFGTSTF